MSQESAEFEKAAQALVEEAELIRKTESFDAERLFPLLEQLAVSYRRKLVAGRMARLNRAVLDLPYVNEEG